MPVLVDGCGTNQTIITVNQSIHSTAAQSTAPTLLYSPVLILTLLSIYALPPGDDGGAPPTHPRARPLQVLTVHHGGRALHPQLTQDFLPCSVLLSDFLPLGLVLLSVDQPQFIHVLRCPSLAPPCYHISANKYFLIFHISTRIVS